MDNIDRYALFRLVANDQNLNQLRMLLRHGLDPNHSIISGYTPLHLATMSMRCNPEVIRELINAGADVNVFDHFYVRPLHWAVYKRKLCEVEVLINFGANVNAKNFQGKTPLHFAVISCNLVPTPRQFQDIPNQWIIKTLLKHEDIDCNSMDFKGDTPLMVAIKDRQSKASKILLYKGANPNISNSISLTPLHVALQQEHISIIPHLLTNGASIYAEDKNGQSPMDILIRKVENNHFWFKYFKFIIFKYRISVDLKRKFERVSRLSKYFLKWCKEVDRMKEDYICGNITVHDFVWGCFNDAHISGTNLIWHIYNPVMERLVADIYPEYLPEILNCLPRTALLEILKSIVWSRNNSIRHNNIYDIVMFSNEIIVQSISRCLPKMDIFSFTVALSNWNIPKSMKNLHKRRNRFVIFNI